MPFIDNKPHDLGPIGTIPGSNQADRTSPKRPAFFSETIPAAWRIDNTVGSFLASENIPTRANHSPINKDFNPFQNIKGYEDHAKAFAFADTPQQVTMIKHQIDRENEDRRILAASGWPGIAARVATGVVDPVNFIPVGGTAYKTYRITGRILEGALTTARAGLLSTTAAETLLHHSQQTRTFGESAANITVGTFISGILGGGFAGLKAGLERRAVSKAYGGVNRSPQGSANDPLVNIRPSDIESTVIARGGWKGLGGVEVKGQGWGLVKFILRHGEKSDKPDGLRVAKSDVTAFPSIIRQYEAMPGSNAGNRLWVVENKGRRVAYADRRFKEDGKRRVVSIHIVGKGDLAKYPLSPKKTPGASSGRDFRVPPKDTAGGSFAQPRQGRPADYSIAPDAAKVTNEWEALQARLEADLTIPHPDQPDPLEPGFLTVSGKDLSTDTGGGSVGAATVHNTTLAEEGLKSALGLEKALAFQDPLLRTATSPSIETRRVMQDLAESPLKYAKNAKGLPTAPGGSVETRIKMHSAGLYQAIGVMDEAFVRYRRGQPGKTFARFKIAASDLTGEARQSGMLTYKEFKIEAGKAARRNDQHPIPEVSVAAQVWRRFVFDPLKDKAIEQGLLPEDVTVGTADSYLMRLYNAEKIVAQRPSFVRVVTDWLGRRRDQAASNVTELGNKLDKARRTVSDLRRKALAELTPHNREISRLRQQDKALARDEANARKTTRQAGQGFHTADKRHQAFTPSAKANKADKALLADLLRGRPAGPKPKTLTSWLVSNGGLQEDGGELAGIGISAKARPGLLNNKTGMNFDAAALKAWENGYFPLNDSRPDINQFLDALRSDFNGHHVYQGSDFGTTTYTRDIVDLTRSLESMGVDLNKIDAAELRDILNGDPYRKTTAAARGKVRELAFQLRRARERLTKADRQGQNIAAKRDQVRGQLATVKSLDPAVRERLNKLKSSAAETGREIDQLQKDLARAKYDAGFEDIELEDIAQQITDRILGTPDGRLPYDIGKTGYTSRLKNSQGLARPMKARSFLIKDSLIEPWLESDIELVGRVYHRSMAPDVELAAKYGSVDMTSQISAIRSDYNNKIMKAATDGKRTALDKRAKADIRDVAAVRDRLRGTYALPRDPSSIGNRVIRGVKNFNYLRLLGGMTLSALADPFRIVMTQGLKPFIIDGLLPLVIAFKATRLAGEEVKLAGTAGDMILDTRTMALADVMDDFGRHSRFERGLQGLTNNFGLVSLMAPWNAFWKQLAGMVIMTRMLKAADAVVSGKIAAKETENLAASGIDHDMARRLAAQFAAHGETTRGVRIANTNAWTDRGAVESFRAALVRDVDRTIVTPGQDKPLWISTKLGGLIGQFKSFQIASVQRTLLAGLQDRDASVLAGFVLSVGAGMGIYALKSWIAGHKTSDKPAVWLANGLDRSGMFGWLFDANNIVEKLSGGAVGISALTGGKTMSRYYSRNWADALLGPTAGLAKDFGTGLAAIANGDPSKSDTQAIWRLMPYRNLFYTRQLLDKAKAGLDEKLGVRK